MIKNLLFPKQRKHSYIQLAVGVFLMTGGVLLLWPTAPDVPTPVAADLETNQEPQKPVPDKRPQTWRLRYDRERGFWEVAAKGDGYRRLTDIIPGPRDEQIRTGFIPLTDVRIHLLSVLQSWELTLDDTERNVLFALTLDGNQLFRPGDFDQDQGAIVPKSIAGDSGVVINRRGFVPPAKVHPLSTDMKNQFGYWREKITPFISGNEQPEMTKAINLTNGNAKRLLFSGSALGRISNSDFGNQAKDYVIGYQIIAAMAGSRLVIDGMSGPKTRAALTQAWQGMGAGVNDSEAFTRYVSQWFSEQPGASLKPGTSAFKNRLNTWRQHIAANLPMDTAASFSYVPQFKDKPLRIDVSPVALQRLRAADFGSKRIDEQIYLQCLINEFGERTRVDGNLGAGSRSALRRILTGPLGKTTEINSYINQLQQRFRG